MKLSSVVLIPSVVVCVFLEGKSITQSDWQAGPGILGPVEDFGAAFYESSGINFFYQPKRLSLSIVLSSSPEKHHIWDNNSQLDKKIEVADLGGPKNKDSSDILRANYDVALSSTDGISWFPNNGEGKFYFSRQVYPAGSAYLGYDLADFNNDGFADAVIGDYGSGWIYLYFNNGSGDFTQYSQVGYFKGVHQVAVADFDSDGDIDVVATKHHREQTPAGPELWFENDGTNKHFISHKQAFEGNAARRIHTGDLDNDGDIDFLVSGFFYNRQVIPATGYWGTYWMENQITQIGPDSGFVPHLLDTTRKNLYDWIADVNKDGKKDIVVTNVDDSVTYPQWWENDLPDGFIMHRLYTSESRNPEGVVAIDIDYDADVDIIQSYFGPTYSDTNGKAGWLGWFENNGKEHFDYHRFANYPQSCDLQVGDMDGNGLLDLVTSTHNPGRSTDWWDLFERFESNGELTSSVFDAGEPSFWNKIDWNADTSRLYKTRVSFRIRTSNDPANWPDWEDCPEITRPSSLNTTVVQQTRYMQYKVSFVSGNPDHSPMLYEVSIDYGSTSVKEEGEQQLSGGTVLEISGSKVRYSLGICDRASLGVYDASGRRERVLDVTGEGVLNLGDLAGGVYFVVLDIPGESISRKFVILR